MNIYNYLNKRNILKNMSDDEFDIFLPQFAEELEKVGFDSIISKYNQKLKDEEMDWENLKKKRLIKITSMRHLLSECQ